MSNTKRGMRRKALQRSPHRTARKQVWCPVCERLYHAQVDFQWWRVQSMNARRYASMPCLSCSRAMEKNGGDIEQARRMVNHECEPQ